MHMFGNMHVHMHMHIHMHNHHPGELVAKVGYFGVKSAKVCRAQMGDQTC